MDTERPDHLVQRIRERAADPAGRTEERPSEFWSSVTAQSLCGLLGMGRFVAWISASQVGRYRTP